VSGAPARCIVCGDAPQPLFERAGVAVVRSPGCGLEWRTPFPSEAQLRELYAGDYLERWGGRDAASYERVRRMKRATHACFLREIVRLRRGGRLLDVGCATGFLLEVAQEQGFEPFGLDPNPQAVRLARSRFGDRVQQGELDAGVFEGVAFDVVTLIDVLEHVPDPAALLASVRERLAPGGVLAAVLPNSASLVRRLLGRRWPHYAPEHLFFWTPGALERQLDAAGFGVRAIRTGIRKTFTGDYLSACAACTGAWLPPGIARLGRGRLRVPTGEMLALAVRR